MLSIQDARSAVLLQSFTPGKSFVNIDRARNFFLAEDIAADRDYPPFNRAAVDGFAVSLADLQSKINSFEIQQEIFAGQEYAFQMSSGGCVKIMTGAAVPDGLDVIFKVEDCITKENLVQIPDQKYCAGMNIAHRGENAKSGSVLIKKGSQVNQRSVHSLAAVGIKSVPVFCAPAVSIISTGNELVGVDSIPDQNQIRDSNYYGLLYELEKFKIAPANYCIVKDNKEELKTSIQSGLKSDLLIISGGVSMGDADFVPGILEELGVKNIFHNVNIKPGKPLWFGKKESNGQERSTIVFALPGNPLSTLVSYKIFIEPWLCKIFQTEAPLKLYLPMQHDRNLKGNRPEYFPAKISRLSVNETSSLEALIFHGSGDISAALNSDGLAFHTSENPVLKKGDVVEFLPWSTL